MPRVFGTLGTVVLIGRELYRYGYMTNDGPNSRIREAGAIPLNAAEFFMMVGVGGLALQYFCGPFFARRGFVKRLTMSKIDRKIEYVRERIARGKKIE